MRTFQDFTNLPSFCALAQGDFNTSAFSKTVNLKHIFVIAIVLLQSWCVTGVWAQNPYPATKYKPFPNESRFATSTPIQSDSLGTSNSPDYRSMSPSSWDNPAIGANDFVPNQFQSRLGVTNSENSQLKRSVQFSTPASQSSSSLGNGVESSGRLPLAQPNRSNSNPFQSTGYPISQVDDFAVSSEPTRRLPTAPQVPTDIRQKNPAPTTVLTPPLNSTNANEFTYQNSGNVDRSQPTGLSIVRSPHDEISAPPTSPWKYPDSRTTSLPTFAGAAPNFRTDLGHRDSQLTQRNGGSEDYGQKFDFEKKKKEYPPLSEIFATGRYFGSATMMYLRPSFTGNASFARTISGNVDTFDFDYEAAPQFQFGFESKYGPGVELTYWQYDETSNPSTFTSDGIEAGTTSAWMMGSNQWSRLIADDNGETLNANHTIDVESIGVAFFKEVQLPISRINGKFGLQYVSIAQNMNATLTDSGATEIGNLRSRSDLRALGPQFKLEYFRPIGHTKIEFMTTFGGSVLFGKQDQFVSNTANGNLSRIGADEFLTIFDFFSGAQYRKMIAENRYWFVRGGVTSQAWLNGGNAILPQDDFGLRGFTFTIGYNR